MALTEKGTRFNLCEAPFGPFRQIKPGPFFGRKRQEKAPGNSGNCCYPQGHAFRKSSCYTGSSPVPNDHLFNASPSIRLATINRSTALSRVSTTRR